MKGFAFILNISTDISMEMAMLLSLAIILMITLFGGLISVAYTDALSSIFMVTAFLIAIPLTLKATNGFDGMLDMLPETAFSGGLSRIQWLGAATHISSSWRSEYVSEAIRCKR